MEKPTLFALVGLPYSGKTTFAQLLAEKTGGSLIAYDWIWAREKPPASVPDLDHPQEWHEVLDIARTEIRQKLLSGTSVIFDHINHTKSERQVLAELAREAGANYLTVYLNVPQVVLEERRVCNQANQTRHHVAPANLVKVSTLWEPPNEEKDVVVYLPNQDVDAWLRSAMATAAEGRN